MADSAQRALLPPVCPRRRQEKEKKKRERERWRGERERELGCRARGGAGGCGECEVCSAPRQFASSASLPSPPLGEASVHASSRTQAPLSGGDGTPLPPPSTSEDQSDPCLALRESRPSLPRRGPLAIFIHCFYRDAFRGDSGEATPSLVSNRCAPRSGTLLAESSREELPRYEDGALETPVSPARLLCLPLGAGADPRGIP